MLGAADGQCERPSERVEIVTRGSEGDTTPVGCGLADWPSGVCCFDWVLQFRSVLSLWIHDRSTKLQAQCFWYPVTDDA